MASAEAPPPMAGGTNGAPATSATRSMGSGMTRDFAVANVRAPLLVWLSLILSAVSFFFHLLAFSMVEWVLFDKGKFGLWRSCINGLGCSALPSINDAHRACQAFATMAFILMLVTVVVTAVYIYLPQLQNSGTLKIGLIAAHGIAAFMVMLTFSIYHGQIIAKFGMPGTKPGASFGLDVVVFVMELAGTGILVLDLFTRATP